MVRNDDVIAGGRSIEKNLLVAVHAGSPIHPEYLIMLRHAERLHALAILGLDAFHLQFAPDRERLSHECRTGGAIFVFERKDPAYSRPFESRAPFMFAFYGSYSPDFLAALSKLIEVRLRFATTMMSRLAHNLRECTHPSRNCRKSSHLSTFSW